MMNKIRNFVIIAHVDHGKSTLADRLLEITGTVPRRQLREQFLDQMELERERGITIKMQPVRMSYRFKSTNDESNTNIRIRKFVPDSLFVDEYVLNLIDTPGHVDFSYEVSRALAAVEGAILLVDGTQGIQAQTLANLSLAKEEGLTLIGAINKIDLPIPDLEALSTEVAALIGQTRDKILHLSGKTGEGVERLLEEIIVRIPPPTGNPEAPFRALIFDSKYDPFRGAIAYVRVKEGIARPGDRLYLIGAAKECEAMEVGYFKPELAPHDMLQAGEIGYIATGLKQSDAVKVGDTIINKSEIRNTKYEASEISALALPGYQEPQPLMFAGFYPPKEEAFGDLRDALSKLKLNDAALTYVEERQAALGKGFRVGFLGALHMEIAKERLSREYGIEPLITMPTVRYRLKLKDGREIEIETPEKLPPRGEVLEIQEPWVSGEIILPSDYLNAMLGVLHDARGNLRSIETLERNRLIIHFEAPLAELVVGFYDKVKSVSRGYASVAYKMSDWRKGDLVKLEILVAGKPVEALSRIVPRQDAERLGRQVIIKLKELLPREVFAVPLQAAVEGRIIARETIPALKKNVTAHLYGGDRTRKMKLWEKQKTGKKRLAQMGKVTIEPKIFFDLLKLGK
jgi:GTP-binding protein LepA